MRFFPRETENHIHYSPNPGSAYKELRSGSTGLVPLGEAGMLYSALGNGVNPGEYSAAEGTQEGERGQILSFLLIWKENFLLLSLWGEEYTPTSAFPTTALILTFNSPPFCWKSAEFYNYFTCIPRVRAAVLCFVTALCSSQVQYEEIDFSKPLRS